MSQRKIAAYLHVNFSPAFLAQRVGGRPRCEALIEGTWRVPLTSGKYGLVWFRVCC